MPQLKSSTQAAVEAFRRGYQPVPIRNGSKRPMGSAWTQLRWESEEQVITSFESWHDRDAGGVGLLLGEPSGGLIDVDLDDVSALRLKDYFLPPTPMQSGRVGKARSHRWYVVEGDLPATRRYKLPNDEVSVELRSTGGQTIIPPSTWYPKKWSGKAEDTEQYLWEGRPWGGKRGPAKVDGQKLAVQVALLQMGSVLLDNWAGEGSRHDAYLALAGGLLRYGDTVHPYWERNLPVLIEALADATHDDDGPEQRVYETMQTTLERLREGDKAVGFPRLAEIIGVDHAELVRRAAREVEQLARFNPTIELSSPAPEPADALVSSLPPEERNPMEERISSWDAVDLEPYLSGKIVMPEPSVLQRSDGKGLFYPGRVNSLYGASESAKSWIALASCVQEMGKGERVMYLDFEDEPAGTVQRLLALGAGEEDIASLFRYVHPEGPLSEMQRYQYGQSATDEGRKASSVFKGLLDSFDPTLIVADGMTVIYGLHGHDTNAATATDVITSWLKSLTRGGRSTVIVIDHTGKTSGPGASPIGAHHKVAMVQGTAIRADVAVRPMQGEKGIVNLVVFKDRPGVVRSYSTKQGEQVAAVITLDSREEGITRVSVDPADDKAVVVGSDAKMEAELARLARVEEVSELVVDMFEGDLDKRITTAEVVKETGASVSDVYSVWEKLKEDGLIIQEGTTRWTKFKLREVATNDDSHNDQV